MFFPPAKPWKLLQHFAPMSKYSKSNQGQDTAMLMRKKPLFSVQQILVKLLQLYNFFQEKETRSNFAPRFHQLWALWHVPALVNSQSLPVGMNPEAEQLQMASAAQTTSTNQIWCSSIEDRSFSQKQSKHQVCTDKQGPALGSGACTEQTQFFTSRAIHWTQHGLGTLSNWIPVGIWQRAVLQVEFSQDSSDRDPGLPTHLWTTSTG